jgi:hypothetical protein
MTQDDKFIQARNKAKKYINFSKWLGGCRSSTYQKISNGIVNGTRNPDLIKLDTDRVQDAINKAKEEIQDAATNGMKAIEEFEQELNRLRE